MQSFSGNESDLIAFENQVNLVKLLAPAATEANATENMKFIVAAVKTRITGNLDNCILPEDNSLDKIIVRVQNNVLKRNSEFYENLTLKKVILTGIIWKAYRGKNFKKWHSW